MTDASDILMPGALTDPIGMTYFFGMENLYVWQQQDILDILEQAKPFAGVYANGVGKTCMVVAGVGLVIMSLYPGSQIVSTSGSWNQIETQLWPALKNMISRHPGWTWNKHEITAPVREVDGIPLQSRWTPFSTNDPLRAEGHHDQWIYGKSGQRIHIRKAYIIDEAKAVEDGIFDAMARCKVSWKAVLSSPGEDSGAFFRCFNDHADLWNTRVRPYTMAPHLFGDKKMRDYVEAEIRVKGREDPVIKSQYFAEFFTGKGYQVFKTEDVAIAMSGLVKKAGTDRAGAFDWSAGGDAQVFAVREGNTVIGDLTEWHERDSTKLARLLVAEFRRHNLRPDEIVIDAGGGGTPFIDLIENMGYRGVRRYVHSAVPLDKIVYADKYTEDAFERVSYNLKAISLPKDADLERELRQAEFKMPNSNNGRRAMVSKEELRRAGKGSPDKRDTLIMLFSNYRPDKSIDYRNVKPPSKCPDPATCFDRDGAALPDSGLFGGWRGDPWA